MWTNGLGIPTYVEEIMWRGWNPDVKWIHNSNTLKNMQPSELEELTGRKRFKSKQKKYFFPECDWTDGWRVSIIIKQMINDLSKKCWTAYISEFAKRLRCARMAQSNLLTFYYSIFSFLGGLGYNVSLKFTFQSKELTRLT